MNQCSPLPGGQAVNKFTIEKVKNFRGEHFKGGGRSPGPRFLVFLRLRWGAGALAGRRERRAGRRATAQGVRVWAGARGSGAREGLPCLGWYGQAGRRAARELEKEQKEKLGVVVYPF